MIQPEKEEKEAGRRAKRARSAERAREGRGERGEDKGRDEKRSNLKYLSPVIKNAAVKLRKPPLVICQLRNKGGLP